MLQKHPHPLFSYRTQAEAASWCVCHCGLTCMKSVGVHEGPRMKKVPIMWLGLGLCTVFSCLRFWKSLVTDCCSSNSVGERIKIWNIWIKIWNIWFLESQCKHPNMFAKMTVTKFYTVGFLCPCESSNDPCDRMSPTTGHFNSVSFHEGCSITVGSTGGQCFWHGCNWTDCRVCVCLFVCLIVCVCVCACARTHCRWPAKEEASGPL